MINNPIFLQYKNKQFTNYSLNYFYDKSKPSDSLHNIISYQLRGEQNGVISNFKNFKIKRIIDTIFDITKTDTNKNDSNEEEIINEIIEKLKNLYNRIVLEKLHTISKRREFQIR